MNKNLPFSFNLLYLVVAFFVYKLTLDLDFSFFKQIFPLWLLLSFISIAWIMINTPNIFYWISNNNKHKSFFMIVSHIHLKLFSLSASIIILRLTDICNLFDSIDNIEYVFKTFCAFLFLISSSGLFIGFMALIIQEYRIDYFIKKTIKYNPISKLRIYKNIK